jgi:small nuclear ribonucleoprotein (snRNP)-like protein
VCCTSPSLGTNHAANYSTACCFIIFSTQLVDQIVRVKCLGGRELRGALRGYDELVNLVLDDCEEFIRGEYTLLLHLCGCFFFPLYLSSTYNNINY